MHIFNTITAKTKTGKKQLALLIDPEKYTVEGLKNIINIAIENHVDYFLVGGSLVSGSPDALIESIKALSNLPVILYPGSHIQLSGKADAMFLLSLISGRNPEYLIGNHVIAAPVIKKLNIEVIPVGYMLFESEGQTSVEYISNTKPLPVNKPDIAVATALAGEMLGMRMIYLEAGSGASSPVPASVITAVRESISIPLIVGGGIRDKASLYQAFKAGADIAVIGTAIEQNPALLAEFLHVTNSFLN